MTTFAERELAGWGRFPVQECLVARPEKRRDLVADAADGDVPDVLARGRGRSYGDAALNNRSGVILTEKLERYLGFDAATATVHAEAGVTFEDILATFVPRGYFLPVTPGTKFVSLGGAIACDVHGKNHHRDGCLSSFIDEIQLLLASGEVVTCSRTQDPQLFWATVGGMGLTGIILSAKLRLLPIETACISAAYRRTDNLDETLEQFGSDSQHRYSVAWIDCMATGNSLGRSVLIRGEHALPDEVEGDPLKFTPPKGKSVPLDFPNFALNSGSVRLFNALYYAAHPSGQQLTSFESFFWPLDAVSGWNRVYGNRGFIQYQCVMPFESSRDGLVLLLEKISAAGRASFLAVLKTFGAQSPAPLGFPFPGHTLALDLPASPGIIEFSRELDQIVLAHSGRCYLAKDATMEAASAQRMYPRLDEWRQVKARVDPGGRFNSSLARRLNLFEGALR